MYNILLKMIFSKIIIFLIIISYINSFQYFFKKKIFSNIKINNINNNGIYKKNNNKLMDNKLIDNKLSNNIFSDNKFSIIGISLQNNTIMDIEKILVNKNKLPKFYSIVIKNKIADEIIALSTCNRFELYTCSKNATDTINKLENILLSNNKCTYNTSVIKNSLYIKKNIEVLDHLIKVSSGLNSLIFGEKQIEEQLKKLLEFK